MLSQMDDLIDLISALSDTDKLRAIPFVHWLLTEGRQSREKDIFHQLTNPSFRLHPIIFALTKHNFEVGFKLLQRIGSILGPNHPIYTQEHNGFSPIHPIIRMHRRKSIQKLEVIKWLIQIAGTEILFQLTDRTKQTCIHSAIESGDCAVIEFILFLAPKLVSIPNSYGETPLHVASRYGHLSEIVRLLLQFGADMNAPNADGMLPIHHAMVHATIETVELLLPSIKDLPNESQSSLLWIALSHDNYEAAEMLVDRCPDLLNPFRFTYPIYMTYCVSEKIGTILRALDPMQYPPYVPINRENCMYESKEVDTILSQPIPPDTILKIRHQYYFENSLVSILISAIRT